MLQFSGDQPEKLYGAIHMQGKFKQWRSAVPAVLGCLLSSWRAFTVPQLSLCGLSLLLVQELFDWLTIVSQGNSSKIRAGVSSASTGIPILDRPPPYTF